MSVIRNLTSSGPHQVLTPNSGGSLSACGIRVNAITTEGFPGEIVYTDKCPVVEPILTSDSSVS